MRQAAADGAAVADRQMRDMRHGGRHDRKLQSDQIRKFEIV